MLDVSTVSVDCKITACARRFSFFVADQAFMPAASGCTSKQLSHQPSGLAETLRWDALSKASKLALEKIQTDNMWATFSIDAVDK